MSVNNTSKLTNSIAITPIIGRVVLKGGGAKRAIAPGRLNFLSVRGRLYLRLIYAT